MTQALAICSVHRQQFAAPRRAIRPETDAIEGQTKQWGAPAMLGADGGNVGVMMRNGDGRQSVPGGKGERGVCAVVVRMQVVRDDLRFDFEQVKKALKRFVEEVAGCGIIEIADVRRQERLVATGNANAAFQMRAKGQH